MSDQGNDLDYRNVLNYVQAILVSKKAEVGQIQLHLRDKSTAPYSYKKDFTSPESMMHMNIHCKSNTAVTQGTDKAHVPLV